MVASFDVILETCESKQTSWFCSQGLGFELLKFQSLKLSESNQYTLLLYELLCLINFTKFYDSFYSFLWLILLWVYNILSPLRILWPNM